MNLLNDFKTREFHLNFCDFRNQTVFFDTIEAANRQFRIHRKSLKKKAFEK